MPNTRIFSDHNTIAYPIEYLNCSLDIATCLECCDNEDGCPGTVVWNGTCYYLIDYPRTTIIEIAVIWLYLLLLLLGVVGYVYFMRRNVSETPSQNVVTICKPTKLQEKENSGPTEQNENLVPIWH